MIRARAELSKLLQEPRVAAALAFVVSRLGVRIGFDVRLDASPIYYFLQFLDPYFLQTDLLRSVLSLHHQAPLLNLALGVALKLFGRFAVVALDVGFIALGLWACVSLAELLQRLGVGSRWAGLFAALFACSSTTILYESWLFYPHVVACLLIASGNLLLRFVETKRLWHGIAFFAALAAVGLTRSTYGPLWFVAIALALLWLAPVPRRRLARAAALPLAILLLHAAKTPLYVGHGYGEAMLWPNLAKKIFVELPRKERKRILRRHDVSDAVKLEAFTDLRSMGLLRVRHEPTGIPALDDAHAPSGRPNSNALEYVLIAERYNKPDAMFLARHYPGTWAKASLAALKQMPMLATIDSTLVRSPNFAKLRSLDRATAWLVLAPDGGLSPVILTTMLLALVTMVRDVVRRTGEGGAGRRALALFALLTVGYVTAVSVLVSWGDFPRYRFEIDGLFWMFAVVGGLGLARRLFALLRRSRRPEPASPGAAP